MSESDIWSLDDIFSPIDISMISQLFRSFKSSGCKYQGLFNIILNFTIKIVPGHLEPQVEKFLVLRYFVERVVEIQFDALSEDSGGAHQLVVFADEFR